MRSDGSQKTLERYDTDGDGVLDAAELEAAIGFELYLPRAVTENVYLLHKPVTLLASANNPGAQELVQSLLGTRGT